MTNVPCPRCGMLLGLDEVICPHCRTPRDDMEMEEGRALVRNEELRRERQPKLVAAGAAALAALCLAWFMRERIIGSMAVAWHDFTVEVEKARDPRHLAASRKNFSPPETIFSTPATDPQPQVAVSSFIYAGDARPSFSYNPAESTNPTPHPPATKAAAPPAREPEILASAAPAPEPPSSAARRFYGVIYDIDSLKPIIGAHITFRRKGRDDNWSAISNGMGHYRLDLFKDISDNTVLISAAVPGYRPGLIEDKDPPLLERSRSARKQFMVETTDSDLEAVPLRFRNDDELVELNLVVVPAAKQ